MSHFQPLRPCHYLGPSPDIIPIARLKWRLVVGRMGVYRLHEVSLLSTDRGPDVIEKLFREYNKAESRLASAVPVLVPTIYTATLAPLPIDALTPVPIPVDIDAVRYSHILTSGLHKRSSLPTTSRFLASYARFASVPEPARSIRARDAILIKLQLSKLALLVFSTLTSLLAVLAGALSGVFRHSFDTGLGVFGTVLGIVGVIEGFLTWRLK